eukprot:5835469-Ditylum_brightwellii.AAC.1
MVLVAHLPVAAVGDTAVEARGETKVIYTSSLMIDTSIYGCQDLHSRIYFHSLAEERKWVEQCQHKCHSQKSLFDAEPTMEQLMLAEANETHVVAASASSYLPNGGNGQAGASLSSSIALVE